MATSIEMKLDKRFTKQAQGVFNSYHFDVGVLHDKPHRIAQSSSKGLKTIAGGPSRKIGRRSSGLSVSQVSEQLRQRSGINFYTKPFKSRRNKDVLRCINAFFNLFLKRGQPRRVENALQAVVRNPFVRGDYGGNSIITTKIKGFSRFGIDTAQLFNSIKGKVTRLRRPRV